MNFLIRADATPEMGSGHIMRCIALGQMLQDSGHSITFATKTNNQKLLQRIKSENFFLREFQPQLSLNNDANQTVDIALNNGIDFIITDGYHFDTNYQQIIKVNNLKLMCIDDIASVHYLSDVVLNQNLNAGTVFNYSVEPYTKLFLGTDYSLLRREFRENKNFNRVIDKDCKKILVTLGGGDAKNYSGFFLQVLNDFNKNKLEITVLLGPGFMFVDEIKKIVSSSFHNINIEIDVKNVVPLMQWCDLAITAAGSTVWELITLQTPMLVGIAADNQLHIAEQLNQIGAAKNLGWFTNIDKTDFLTLFESYVMNEKIRYRQIENHKTLNPGNRLNDLVMYLEKK